MFAQIIIGGNHLTGSQSFMLVGAVEKRQADLSMNLALTGAREKVVDYSVAYIGWCHHCLCLCLFSNVLPSR